MNRNKYYQLLLICFVAFSCKKETTSSSTTIPTNCIAISGYTGTDNLNQLTGVVDTTDWRLDDNWSQCEKDLFGGSNFNTNCIFDDTLLSNPGAYPNPASDIFNIDIGLHVIPADTNIMKHDSLINMDLLFINQRNEKIGFLHTNKSAINSSLFSLNQMDSFPGDTIFRIYYKLTDENNCIKMGHGDIVRR